MTEKDHDHDCPTWDGTSENFERYELKLHYFIRQQPSWKESQQLARAIRSLKSKAWDLVERLSEKGREQLEKSEKVYIAFLRKHLLDGEVPELGRQFRLYLGLHRLRKESMLLYVLRHRELLHKLGKNIQSVEGKQLKLFLTNGVKTIEHEPSESEEESEPADDGADWPKDPWKTPNMARRVWGRPKVPGPTETGSQHSKAGSQKSLSKKSATGSAKSEKSSANSAKSKSGSQKEWTDEDWRQWNAGTWKSKDDETFEEDLPKLAREELLEAFQKLAKKLPTGGQDPDLLNLIEKVAPSWREEAVPSLLSGWHLLQKSGLNPAEQSTILAASSMSAQQDKVPDSGNARENENQTRMLALRLDRIENAFRTQWQDEDLVARDEKQERKGNGTGRYRKHSVMAAEATQRFLKKPKRLESTTPRSHLKTFVKGKHCWQTSAKVTNAMNWKKLSK